MAPDSAVPVSILGQGRRRRVGVFQAQPGQLNPGGEKQCRHQRQKDQKKFDAAGQTFAASFIHTAAVGS